MKAVFFIAFGVIFYACQRNGNHANRSYIIAIPVEAYGARGADAVVEKIESDTVEAPSALAAYSKGVQKYASVLMHVAQFPDSIKEVKDLRILDDGGVDIVSTVPQNQRDSIIMHFIQFARRSDIPYYDRVKDFELKLMKIR